MHLSTFIQQKPYEHVVHKLRRHPITFLPKVILLFVLLILPLAVVNTLRPLFSPLSSSPTFLAVTVLGGSIYTLSILLFFYTAFIQYYLELWIVTNDQLGRAHV